MPGTVHRARPALPALTGLRFLAALWVVLYHFGATAFAQLPPTLEPYISRLMRHGYVGVSLFFVLSGLVLAYNYAHLAQGSSAAQRRQFWLARFARIAPLYYLALVLSLPLMLRALPVTWDPMLMLRVAIRILAESTFTQAWTPWTVCTINCPGWSLSAEAVFYVLTPWLLVVLGALPLGRSALGLWLAAIAPALLFALTVPMTSPEQELASWVFRGLIYMPLWHLPQFMLGLVAGLYLARGGASQSWWGVTVALGLGLLVLVCSTGRMHYPLFNNGLVAPLFVLLLLYLARSSSHAAKILAHPVSVKLGEISYGFYLLQLPVAKWLALASGGKIDAAAMTPEQLILYLGVLAAVSWVAYRWLELPARRWIVARWGTA